ncbi:6,7-dimethyl-8-ribityllumazine synthase, chloroplastic [Triticum urartu]|uniref:6,7-dimethyl-8-ribityllumazine synthase n=1 Tax=Triticum urartu TaxID=4572 RepID=M8AJN2_TRIUA|nr:6,7-dimethyl-8-ribityllumazine synthase, chloroplastic [Triticum urartu]
MAASPATSSSAARATSFARLSNAPLRAPRAGAVSFPSPNSARPAALVADARASRLPVVAAAAAGHQRLMGSLTNTEGLRFAVVVARFNEIVTNLLLQGALEAFERYSIKAENVTVVSVPGSFEIPVAAQKLGKSGKLEVTQPTMMLLQTLLLLVYSMLDCLLLLKIQNLANCFSNVTTGVPCVFGVLTCDDMDQALNRAGGKAGNKGAETAITAASV